MNEAAEVTVVVVSAKGLQSKRTGKCKFSVIFGVGSKKYRTTVVKDPDGNPEWNEESTIQVANSLDQVFFIVTEKDDVLGQINVPITNLSGPPGHTTIETLQPHKKCPNPKGELVYRCHVSQYRQAQTPIIKSGSPNRYESKSSTLNFKKRFSITNSPIINLKNRRDSKQGGSGSKLSTLNKKFSRSIQDIFSFGKSHQDEENQKQMKSSGHNYMSIGTGLDSAGRCPIITSVTPSCGLIEGGTKVTIEGKFLGLSKADIMELTICECDCVESVIWESPNRIHCTTKPSLPGIGDVVIETESGGIGCLRNIYSYVEDLPQEEEVHSDEEDLMDGRRSASFTVGGSVPSSPLTPKKTVQKSHSCRIKVILPRAESSENVHADGPPKNSFMKHKRRASEGFILAPSKNRLSPSSPEPTPSMDHLLCQIEKLRLENIALKQENKDMKSYIDRLLPKVIENCPEALEAERYLNKTG